MATATDASELGQFFDFGEAAVSEMPLSVAGDVPMAQESGQCPVHGAERTAGSPATSAEYVFTVSLPALQFGPVPLHGARNFSFCECTPHDIKAAHPGWSRRSVRLGVFSKLFVTRSRP